MKYDLQIIVPCVPDRLECFQRFGLYNIENRKVLVYCLVDDKNHFEKNWPENVDVEKRWKEWIAYETAIISRYGNKETVHG